VLRSEHLREELGYVYGEFAGHFTVIDRAVSALRRNVSPSILLSLAGISFAFLRRIPPIRWATRGFVALSLVVAMIRSRRGSRSLRR
jgi:hypothetical protein